MEKRFTKFCVRTAIALGYPALSDDSGLTVATLDGAPGVYSARWAGPDATDIQIIPVSSETTEGRCEGMILREPAGSDIL